jgi:hypothetical protein
VREKVSALRTRGRILEDAFFLRHNAVLIEKQKELKRQESSLKTLSEISGITNKLILFKLLELDVRPEVLATLSVIPLVEMAWADGLVQEKEREAVLKGAEGCGVSKEQIDYTLLEEWLRHQPPKTLIESWIHYIKGLCELLGEADRRKLKDDLVSRARAVAEAAGGFLGLTSRISPEEKELLRLLESAFED